MYTRAATYPEATRAASPVRLAVLPRRLLVALLGSLLLTLALATAPPATAATPTLLANLDDGPTADLGSEPVLLARLGDGRAVFSAFDPRHGREPWVTDGTPEGTHRIADLVPGPESSMYYVDDPVAVGGGDHVFFLAEASGGDGARDWWATDGTADGTHLLVGGLSSTFLPPSTVWLRSDAAGRAFLLAQDSGGGPGLWVSDGSVAGTRRLALPGLPQRRSAGEILTVLGERVLFVAGTGVGGSQELWASDGTGGGTRRLAPPPVAGPPLGQHPSFGIFEPVFRAAMLDDGTAVVLQDLGLRFYSDRTGLAVWRSDGTAAGTRRVAEVEGRLFGDVFLAGARATFCVLGDDTQSRLWWSDGTADGTGVVFDDCPENHRWLDGRLFYSRGLELGVVDDDGTATHLADLPGSVASPLLPIRGGVAFLVDATDAVQELWWSDGTAAGTRRLADLGPRDGVNGLVGSYSLDDGSEVLLLSLGQGDGAWDLFASDGTVGDPVRLTQIGFPQHLLSTLPDPPVLPVGTRLLFAIDDGVHGTEPWVSDGAPTGTALLANISDAESDGDGAPHGFVPFGDDLLFFAHDSGAPDSGGWGLWRSDGTTAGTRRLLRLDFETPPLAVSSDEPAVPLAVAGDRLYFTLPSADATRRALVVADLTVPALHPLGDFSITGFPAADSAATSGAGARPRVGSFPGDGSSAVALGDGVLWEPSYGLPLVFSDGTAAGTRILPLRTMLGPRTLAALADGTGLVAGYTRTADGAFDETGLWRTDGTAEGTHRILASNALPYLQYLTPRPDGTVVFAFAGNGSSQASGLWHTDGTAEGTALLEPFAGQPPSDLVDTAQGLFFFLPGELWLRPAGAAASHPLFQGTPGEAPLGGVFWARPFASGILFAGYDVLYGGEPWVSDATAAGTQRLGDLAPGIAGEPSLAVVDDAQAFFTEAGSLWRTDGTPAGTFPVVPAGSTPLAVDEQAVVGERLIFAGFDFATGREPWWLPTGDLTPPPPTPPPSVPAAPRDLRAVSAVSSVTLAWTRPSGLVRTFEVEVRLPGADTFEHYDTVSSPSLYTSRLQRDQPYVFRVRAVNESGASPPSNEVTASRLSTLPEQCEPSAGVLCLLGGRFEVSAWWRDPRSGDFGRARAEPLAGNDLSGTFWFFRDGNVELIVKALDGTAVNRRWWIFTGGLTDVEYWLQAIDLAVTESDPESAVTWYHHPSGDLCGFADTGAFAGEPGLYFPLPAAANAGELAPTSLDLLGGRYRVSVDWRDPRSGDTGVGHAAPGSDGSGYFWFFRPDNVELVVKVLDGTPVNGHRWVFYGGLTDVEYTLRVEDLLSDEVRTYGHPAGDLCGGADTNAFGGTLAAR